VKIPIFLVRLFTTACIILTLAGASACGRPETALLGGSWDDLSVYRDNLVQSGEAALDSLQKASVYHMDLTIDPSLQTIGGRLQVRYTNRESAALTEIYFQLFPNSVGGSITISEVRLDGRLVEAAVISGGMTLRVPLVRSLQPGAAVTAQLDFTVAIPRSLAGSTGLFGYFNSILTLDCFYPVIPVNDDSGWHIGPAPGSGDHTFLDTSFYLVRVRAPASLTLAASGVETARSVDGADQVVTFAAGPARDFFLAGSDKYAKVSAASGETTINSYYLPGLEGGADTALKTAAEALETFNRRLGEYPYTELDVVPLPLQGGGIGIEYPGIFGVAASVYPLELTLKTTVVHEATHQWFYNAVGNDQINQPWLDEAVSQYFTGLFFLDTEGPAGWNRSLTEWRNFWNRAGSAPIPIGLAVGDYSLNRYGPIVYGRGPLFLNALAAEISQAAFEECFRGYYQANIWGIATTASFQAWFEACSGKDLDAIFSVWVLP
jgi:hypothetical protein